MVQLPAVGVVQVGEEQHSTTEECEQHEDSVHFVQERVLLLILMRSKHEESDEKMTERLIITAVT